MTGGTWEQRMSAKAKAREHARKAAALEAARLAEQASLAGLGPDDWLTLGGMCDTCRQLFAFRMPKPFLGDFGIDEVGWYTWARHCDGPLPGCDHYMSVVREVLGP